ncbi:reelin domain-containing protein 1-like [Megalops cyprinoides]|uniref:reelin domain-containing protein 1-like n=1 Tax=Megalops cyprinoides TaxID=118141 RepID=UPI0018643C4F|nr:reelin domain-containing protein 1-like [Megalops cyprinoides]
MEILHTSNQNTMPIKVMQTLSAQLLLCAALALAPLPRARAFSQGAKPSSCLNMEPGHIRAQPQDPRHSHVTLQAGAGSYLPGDTVSVAVRSTRDFMGFLLQARTVRDDRVAGAFVLVPPGSRLLRCVGVDDTVTHSDKLLKRNLSFVWRAPDRPLGDVRFLITVVQSYFVYWARIESAVVHDGTESPLSLGGDAATGVDGGGALPGAQVNITGLTGQGQPASGPAPPLSHAITVSAEKSSTASQDAKTRRQSSNGPGPEESALLTSSTEQPAMQPRQPQRSPQTAPDPEPEAGPSPTHLEPPHAPHRSHPDPVTRSAPADPPQQTPGPASRVQKGVVARNLSRGGEAGPPREAGAGVTEEKGKAPGPTTQRSALELGVLLGCSAGLGMVLAAGLRYLHRQYCLKRTAVSLSEHDRGLIHLQDSGELVQVRKIRQNSFVLLQAEYNVMTPPGN